MSEGGLLEIRPVELDSFLKTLCVFILNQGSIVHTLVGVATFNHLVWVLEVN